MACIPLFLRNIGILWGRGGTKLFWHKKNKLFCHKVFREGKILKESNATFLCLIPKCTNASSIRNYRLIGLSNFSYKIITKIIVNRIKPHLDTIISFTQARFSANKKAADYVIIVQEYITHFRKIKGKRANMILKIDLEKAFDRIEWSFIHDFLLYFNFSNKLIHLIMSCVTSFSISILINGKPSQFFEPTRGIRQQAPLISSYSA